MADDKRPEDVNVEEEQRKLVDEELDQAAAGAGMHLRGIGTMAAGFAAYDFEEVFDRM